MDVAGATPHAVIEHFQMHDARGSGRCVVVVVADFCNHRTKIGTQIANQLIEIARARVRSGQQKVAAAIRKHGAEPFARLADTFDQYDVFRSDHDAAHDQIGVEEGQPRRR